jgi:hypothetical protein
MGRRFRDDDRRYIMEDGGGDTRPSGGALEPSGSSSPELRSRALQGAVAYVYLLKRKRRERRSLPGADLDGERPLLG